MTTKTKTRQNPFEFRHAEEVPPDDIPSLTSVIRQNLSVIMAPPEEQFQQIAWPETAELYQPYESNQILLPDSSACLAVRTFLHMNGLHFKVMLKPNAEHMSPSGRLPFLVCGKQLVSEVEPIIDFVNTRITGTHLSAELTGEQLADMKAYFNLTEMVLSNAELYITWADKETRTEISRPRYGSPFPWPLNHILAYRKQFEVKNHLKAVGWFNKTLDQVYEDVHVGLQALSERLNSQDFFFGTFPTELDAVVFGHLYSILTTPLVDNKLAEMVQSHDNLTRFCRMIDNLYFKEMDFQESTFEFLP